MTALASSLRAQDARSSDAQATERARRTALAWTHEARALDRADAVRVANHRSLLRASRPTSASFPSVADLDLAATLFRGPQTPTPSLARAVSYSDTRFHAAEPPAPAVYSVERRPLTRNNTNAATNAVVAAQEAARRVQEQQDRAEQLAQRAQDRGRDALLRVHMTRERDRLTADLADVLARDRERRRDAASVYHGMRNAIHAEMPPQTELNRMFAETFPGAVPVETGKVAARGASDAARPNSRDGREPRNGLKNAVSVAPVATDGDSEPITSRVGMMPTWHTHTLDEMLDELGSLLSASALALDATAASLLDSMASSSCSQIPVPVATAAAAPLEQK
ncbi:hypothetical protein GGF32_009031 [Allomyces javanicus]|nr:hypothetical protein GGF32_009031 [Allomyces javanicus]